MWQSAAFWAINTGHHTQSHHGVLLSPTPCPSPGSKAFPCPLFSEIRQLEGNDGNYLLGHAEINYRRPSHGTGRRGCRDTLAGLGNF